MIRNIKKKNGFLKVIEKKYIFKYSFVLLITIFASGLALIFPYSYARIIEELEKSNMKEIISIILFLSGILLLLLLMDAVRYSLYMITNNQLIVKIKNYFFSLLLKGNTDYLKQYTHAEILNRIEGDINTTVNVLTETIFAVLTYSFSIILTLCVMLSISVKITIVVFIVAISMIIISILVGRYMYKKQKDLVKDIDNCSSFFLESLAGIIDIISFKMQRLRKERYARQNKKIAVNKIKLSLVMIGSNKLISMLTVITVLIIYGFGSYLNIVQKEIELGVIISMVSYANLFFGDIVSLSELNVDTKVLKVAFTRLKELEEILLERHPSEIMSGNFYSILFYNVSFRYENQTIIKNLNLKIEVGDKIAIIGKNGSGKSTLAKLLLGCFHNYDGSILINQKMELKEIDIESYVNYIAYVGEEPNLFQGTVWENLLIGDKSEWDKKEVINELQKYNIFFSEEFMDKNVGYLGKELSAGEKQKVAVARAILKKSTVIIFDESDSHMDQKGQRIFQEILRKIETNKVIINITHNDRELEFYNKILKIEDGYCTIKEISN